MRSYILLSLIALIYLSQTSADRPKSFKLETARNLQGLLANQGLFSLVEAQAGIVQQNPGVSINVYFDRSLEGGSGDLEFTTKGGTLMLSLYSSETSLAKNCLDFKEYNCTQFGCEELLDQTDTATFPNFTASGYYAKSIVTIDRNYWDLNTSAFIMEECLTVNSRKNTYGNGLAGVLGMGIKDNALKNFVMTTTRDSIMGGTEVETRPGNPRFAIFLQEKGKSGELMFDFDSTRALTSTPLVTLSADSDWHVDNVAAVMVADQNLALSTKLIFDINADALGLPQEIYKSVLAAIVGSSDLLSCPTNEMYRPRCTYTGKIENLPDIKIEVGGQSIIIPATTYAEEEKKDELEIDKKDAIFLHLRGLAPDSTNNSNYAIGDFAEYVVLDQHVMGYYYTYFDTTQVNGNSQIKMYVANHGKSDKALVTIIICVVIGLIVGLSIYRYKKIKKARMAANPPLLQTRMGDQEMDLLPGQRRLT